MTKISVNFLDWILARNSAFSAGPGLFGWSHILLICIFFAYLIGMFFVFKYCKKAGKIIIISFCIFMIISRSIRMVIEIASGQKSFFEAMPWHLCHISAFVLPLYVFCKIKFMRAPVIIMAILGGTLTFLFGNYYQFNVLTYYDIESIILHFMLPTVGMGLIILKQVKFRTKDFWHLPVFLIILASYAEIGNTIFKNTNFMFLRENGLPFNFFGNAHFLFTYFVLLVIVDIAFYLPSFIIEKRLKKKNDK